jgi:hypothetical protein
LPWLRQEENRVTPSSSPVWKWRAMSGSCAAKLTNRPQPSRRGSRHRWVIASRRQHPLGNSGHQWPEHTFKISHKICEGGLRSPASSGFGPHPLDAVTFCTARTRRRAIAAPTRSNSPHALFIEHGTRRAKDNDHAQDRCVGLRAGGCRDHAQERAGPGIEPLAKAKGPYRCEASPNRSAEPRLDGTV